MVKLVNCMDVSPLLYLFCVKLVTLSEVMWNGISSQLMRQTVRPAVLILEETYVRKVDPNAVLGICKSFIIKGLISRLCKQFIQLKTDIPV